MAILVTSNPIPTPTDVLINGVLESQVPVNYPSVAITLTDGVNPVVPSSIVVGLGTLEATIPVVPGPASIDFDVYINNVFQQTSTVTDTDDINITIG